MSSQATKLKIGLFVIISLLLGIAAIIWLGATRYLEDATTAVAYFTESVQGLERDSPVKFRGVSVGRVKAIRMAPDARLIEVVIGLDRSFKLTPGLGIKMNLLGLTGQKYLEMDRFREDQKPEPIHLDFEPRNPVIPTYPSDIREIGNALENIFQKLKSVDVEAISYHLVRIAGRLDKILADDKLETIGPDLAETIKEFKTVARKLNDEITRAQTAKGITKTFEKASELLDESSETARTANRFVRRQDNNLNRLSQKLDRTADTLNELLRMIKDKPRGLLFGWDEKQEPPKR